MAKEVSLGNSSNLGKPSYISRDYSPLFGQGIFSSNGPYWTFQRKIIASEFYLDKVKVNGYSFLQYVVSTFHHTFNLFAVKTMFDIEKYLIKHERTKKSKSRSTIQLASLIHEVIELYNF